jgi:DNA-binding transcriptional LysR family regulator
MARFLEVRPSATLDVTLGLSSVLLASLDAGSLDLVVAKREKGTSRGRLIWREPLVWVCAKEFHLDRGRAVPLATLPSPCTYRQKAIAALQSIGRPWQVICTSNSVAGLQAAVNAGIAVAVVSRSCVQPTMRTPRPDEGFPDLPQAEVVIFGEDTTAQQAAKAFARCVADLFEQAQPPRSRVIGRARSSSQLKPTAVACSDP